MSVLAGMSGKAWAVAGGVLTAAAVGGVSLGLLSRDDGGSRGLAPAVPRASATAAPSATPSATPTPTPTPSKTPSPTPSPTPSKTPSPTPSPTVAPTTAPPPPPPTSSGPRAGMAVVKIQNTSTVDAVVTMNGGTWAVPSGTSKTVEVKPEGAGHDAIAVSDAEHAGCGMGDSDWYFEAGKTFTLSITPSRDCYQGSERVDSLTWSISPKAKRG